VRQPQVGKRCPDSLPSTFEPVSNSVEKVDKVVLDGGKVAVEELGEEG
jgi:hypothetical protein